MEFTEKIKEIDSLYSKAVKEEEYLEVIEKAENLKKEMERERIAVEQIAQGILNGLWAEYYWVRKFAKTKENVKKLCTKVSGYYTEIKEPSLKIAYGYLLSVSKSELEEDFSQAKKIEEEIQEIAKKTGNIVAILRVINTQGLREGKEGNLAKAIEVFDEIERFEEIPKEAVRHVGNILNNRGNYKIRGNIDVIGGMRDLVAAMNYYLQEEQPSKKHLEGIVHRLAEGVEKL
ncbi:MAG: hypothetical protein QME61_04415 [Patescibacteria group bacterium]|nr:hypothetical protein [Patescibacteria group bacterium]